MEEVVLHKLELPLGRNKHYLVSLVSLAFITGSARCLVLVQSSEHRIKSNLKIKIRIFLMIWLRKNRKKKRFITSCLMDLIKWKSFNVSFLIITLIWYFQKSKGSLDLLKVHPIVVAPKELENIIIKAVQANVRTLPLVIHSRRCLLQH